MSIHSQLRRSFEKNRQVCITLLEVTDRHGELESLKKRTFAPLKVLICYWQETNNADKSEFGETQYYTAKVRILAEDIYDISEKLNQYCRIVGRIITDTWSENEEWTIETITPKFTSGFRVLDLELKLLKEGNQVRL